jgi:hypothetical protein
MGAARLGNDHRPRRQRPRRYAPGGQERRGGTTIQVGDKSGADDIDFSPKSIGSGAKTTLKFATPWSCSNSGTNTTETYADFKIVLTMDTSGGIYKVDLPNHRMKMATAA